MELSSQMVLFARVVENGSFSGAARAVNHSPSAVSKQIGQLEDRLGLRLVNRTQSGIALTEEGRVFYNRCADVASTVVETEVMLESMASHPKGVLRVAASAAFGRMHLMPLLPAFLSQYPEVSVKLEITDRPVDLVEEEFDIAIRLSEQLENETLIARKLAPNRRVLVAAPSYVAAHGLPRAPGDLAAHNCLRLSTIARWNDWSFEGAGGPVSVPVTGNFETNTTDGVYQAALSGLGIARLSTYLVGADIRDGRLVRLLPDYTQEGSDIYAVYSDRRNIAPKARAFLDFLAGYFGKIPPWERDAEGMT